MQIPNSSLLVVVRGEARLRTRETTGPRLGSSSTFRAVALSPDEIQSFRDAQAAKDVDAFAAADLHFRSVGWAARIDARYFDFASLGLSTGGQAQQLDGLITWLQERTGVPVDRSAKTSNLASFARRSTTPSPGGGHVAEVRFDLHSRMVAEAERLVATTD